MSTAGYVIPVDPTELASRYSHFNYVSDPEDAIISSIDGEDEEEVEYLEPGHEDQVAKLLDRIPAREADLIEMYYILKKKQSDIALIYGVTQAAISYRLDRGIKRIKFLLSIPQVTEEELRRDLPRAFPQQIDVNILVGMWQTTCQSEVALRLGLTQGRVRHRFFKAVKLLEEQAPKNPKLEPYQKIFSRIAKKGFNLARAVSLPQWADRGGDSCG
jgi:DNA-directed RNA polymerase specialized sigma24 family protein